MDENKVDFEKMTPAERLKYEVAEEIGLADKVRQYGWRSLTAKECRLRDLNPHGIATNGF